MIKQLIRRVLLFLGFMILVLFSASLFFWFQMQPPKQMPEVSEFKISRGETLGDIAANLKKQQLIRSSSVFTLYGRLKGTAASMKTGLYRIGGGLSALKIHALLVSGEQLLHRVTLPEGFTVRQIASHLADEGITNEGNFLAIANSGELLRPYGFKVESLEGFLYPDTYLFPLDFPAEKTARTIIENFFFNLRQIAPNYDMLPSGEIFKKVILASVIEREYRVKEEAPLIASVFYNRLNQGMKLQSCATIAYVITEIQGKPHPERLYFSHLAIESEFNTYLYGGLPPASISNPGAAALAAAFQPAQTDYLFFVVNDVQKGDHTFSRTHSEHLNAKNLYLKAR